MSYWTEVDPPMSFIPEGWSYEKKREFRYRELDYLPEAAGFEDFKGQRVLCIGDGGGIDAIEFARNGAFVTMIDMSAKAVELANKHAIEAKVTKRFLAFVGDATDIKIAMPTTIAPPSRFDVTGYYDAVYSFGVIHHIPDVKRVVSEVSRVLKPNGAFIGMVYHRNSLYYAHSILARAQREGIPAERAMQLYSERNPGCPHSIAYSDGELHELLAFDFSAIFTETHYNVVDTPNKRKVHVRITDPAGLGLGWHLFFHAVK